MLEPRPQDYIENYSPLQPAELVLWMVDERPGAKKGWKGLARRGRARWEAFRRRNRDANDLEVERITREIHARWGELSPQTIAAYFREKYKTYDHLRMFEYPFQTECLARPEVKCEVVVDMGGGNSYSTIVPMLLRRPNMQIISVDVVNHAAVSQYGVRYVRGDCLHTNLPAESAHVVTAISTFEHVGLGRWGDPLAVDGDIEAMREAWRILKPNGHLALTLPYGYPTVVFNLHRIYDAGRLARLTQGWQIVAAEYTRLGELTQRSDIEAMKPVQAIPGMTPTALRANGEQLGHVPGGVMLLLRKPSANTP